jgi:hypothetical protein
LEAGYALVCSRHLASFGGGRRFKMSLFNFSYRSKAAVTAAQHWQPVYLSQQTLEVGRQSCTCRLALMEDLSQQRGLGDTLRLSLTAGLA